MGQTDPELGLTICLTIDARAQFPAQASPAGRVGRSTLTGRSGQQWARPGGLRAAGSGRAGGDPCPVYCPGGLLRASGRPGRVSAGLADPRALAGALAGFSRPGEGRAGRRPGRASAGFRAGGRSGRDPARRRWSGVACSVYCAWLSAASAERWPRSGGRAIWRAALRWRAAAASIWRGRDLAAGGAARRRCGRSGGLGRSGRTTGQAGKEKPRRGGRGLWGASTGRGSTGRARRPPDRRGSRAATRRRWRRR